VALLASLETLRITTPPLIVTFLLKELSEMALRIISWHTLALAFGPE
jgi:hypothetical protein